ncbi:MAG: type II toxin-antitoxin system prevent-host-death family antitoxin [Rickettsiales bacterium]
MTTIVTASEFQKNFGQYKELAQREPVSVTSNGRESVVLLSAAEYKEFETFKQSRYAYNGGVTDDFKADVDAFMGKHSDVLDGLAK